MSMTDRFFQDYLAHYQPFKPYWNYEDGCILRGCELLYRAGCGKAYADFVLGYLSGRVMPDGTLLHYPAALHNLDSFHCSKALFFAWELTGEPRFRQAISWQAEHLAAHPRTESGLFWHKEIYPQQIWLDGVYMAAPFLTAYARLTGDSTVYPLIGKWFRYLHDQLLDAETGLYYHALDESRRQKWADPETGRSASHWLRGTGWLLMALTDTADSLPAEQSDLRGMLTDMLNDAVTALLRYQTDDGLFCQVIDRQDAAGNYTETSGSLMAAYALMRGAESGMLPQDDFAAGEAILNAVKAQKLRQTDTGTALTDICASAGLGGEPYRDGSLAYYLSEPAVCNDPKGVGALMLAEAVLRMHRNEGTE